MRKTGSRFGLFLLILSLLTGMVGFAQTLEIIAEEEIPTEEFSVQEMGGVRCEVTEFPAGEQVDHPQVRLFSNGKSLTETLLEGCTAREEVIAVSHCNVSPEEFENAYYNFCMLHPDLFLDTSWMWRIIDDQVLEIKPTYLFSAEELPEKQQQLQNFVSGYASAASRLYQDPVEQLLYVHDSLAANCAYDSKVYDKYLNGEELTPEEAFSFHSYGLFENKTAVCQGYAQAFYSIAKELGIEVSFCRNLSHIWNYVKLDGSWYHLDVTWDDPLRDGEDIPDTAQHIYFLRSDSSMNGHHPHQWKTPLETMPDCTSTIYESGYLFNFPGRKSIVKKDGYYQLTYNGVTFSSDRLWTGNVLVTRPQNGEISYIYLQEPEKPMTIYTARKDAEGVLRGGGVATRTGETMYTDDNAIALHSYTLPTGPAGATFGTVYFRDAETQKPMGPTLNF